MIMSFNAECEFDAMRVPEFLMTAMIRNWAIVRVIGLTFVIDVEESVEITQYRMMEVVDNIDKFADMHRCYQTLQEGTEPNREWYKK